MNLLPAVEAYIVRRIEDLNKYHPDPKARIDELEPVLVLVRAFNKQAEFIEKTLEVPRSVQTPQNHSS